MRGIDVSKWQANIDWLKVKNDDVSFAIIRAGFGNNNIDKFAHSNCVKCNSMNIPIGLYWFSYAYTVDMCKAEALHALDFARKHKIELPIYFDFEYDSYEYAKKHGVNVSRETFCKFVSAFCDTIEKGGYYAGFYVNNDYYRRFTTKELLQRYDIWLADYNTPVYFTRAHMVQYTSSGFIKGITGKCDLNLTDRNYPNIIRKAGLNNLN